MGFYWNKTNRFIKRIFSNYIWDIPSKNKQIYLTFDDGPTPEITNWTLDQLKKHQAKATFFCIGKNIQKNPEIVQKIISDGHAVGNHTFDHLNGWKTATQLYLENIFRCEKELENNQQLIQKLFRPPYGKIKRSQAQKLLNLGYKIIMWDVLSADFDSNITPEKCLENVIKNVQSGSIIVFHDSAKAFQNMKYALPKTLEILSKKGYIFDVVK